MNQRLFEAIQNNDTATTQALIDAGVDLITYDELGRSPLTVAAGIGNLDIVRSLIKAGADVHQISDAIESFEDSSPLAAAVFSGHWAIVDELLPYSHADHKSEVFEAAFSCYGYELDLKNLEQVKALVDFGKVNINANASCLGVWSSQGWSILMEMAASGDLAPVEFLLNAGADPNYSDGDEGATPLMCAIARQNPAMVDLLIQAGSNVNTANHSGKTPLMKAAELGNLPIVKMLIDAGANPKAIDQMDKDFRWYAEKMGHSEICEYLR